MLPSSQLPLATLTPIEDTAWPIDQIPSSLQKSPHPVGISTRSQAPVTRLKVHRDVEAIAQGVRAIQLTTIEFAVVVFEEVEDTTRFCHAWIVSHA